MGRNETVLTRTAVILARMFGLPSLSDSNASETENDVGLVSVSYEQCDSRCCGCIPCIEYAEERIAHYLANDDWTMVVAMMAARNANEKNLQRKVYYRTR